MYDVFDQITLFGEAQSSIDFYYNHGYVFTRLGKGVMQKIRSVRIQLDHFALSSENRRILKKNENLIIEHGALPLMNYDWTIGKLAKDFYLKKFGPNVMSANKIKEMFSDPGKSNMNAFFHYMIFDQTIGYCLLYGSDSILHYSYPFYDLNFSQPNLGMAMMLQAIKWAKENGKQYIYLGSDSRYKHQFKGLEIFDSKINQWL